MIYIFRIRPLVRFFVACVFFFVAGMSFDMVQHIHNPTGIVLAYTQSVVCLLFGLLILPHLGQILWAYLTTWKWR